MKVMSRLVAFLRFCCSLNEMANVTDGHAWFSMNWAWWQACQQKRRRDPQVWLFHCQESWLCAVVTTVHMGSIAMKTSRMLFLALSRWRVFAEDIGNGLNKMKIRWCMLDVCLPSPWHLLDNLDICIVSVWKACRRLKQNSKDCQAVFSQWCCFLLFLKKSTFLVSFLLSFRWLSVLSHVLSEGINKITNYKCLWRHASPFCDRHASRNVVAKTVRRGWRFLSVFIVCGRLWQNKGNENHMRLTWNPFEI